MVPSGRIQFEILKANIGNYCYFIKELFMKETEFSSKVAIRPWVGKNYKKQDIKILILGESTNGPDDLTNTEIDDQIQWIINGNWKHAFYTKILNCFSSQSKLNEGFKNTKENRQIFWNDVCFYEYIQEKLSKPREKVKKELWDSAKEPFKEVLTKLKPDIVLAIGNETYDNLPQEGDGWKTISKAGTCMETWLYKINRRQIYVCKLKHPSGFGFKSKTAELLFENFLFEAKKEILEKRRLPYIEYWKGQKNAHHIILKGEKGKPPFNLVFANIRSKENIDNDLVSKETKLTKKRIIEIENEIGGYSLGELEKLLNFYNIALNYNFEVSW